MCADLNVVLYYVIAYDSMLDLVCAVRVVAVADAFAVDADVLLVRFHNYKCQHHSDTADNHAESVVSFGSCA